MKNYITIIGGGLAGSEAAYQIAKAGINIKLYEGMQINADVFKGLNVAYHFGEA